jgi:benzoylformate decarboxylase
MTSVHDVTYDLLRRHGVITIFGNPGSNDRRWSQSIPIERSSIFALPRPKPTV